jgi:hypothetical protein
MLGPSGRSAPAVPAGAPLGASPNGGGAMRGVDREAQSLVAKAVERLEEVIDQETAALRSRTAVDLREFNDRKSHGLLELTRVMRHAEGTAPDQALLQRLSSLRAKLETNRAVLKMHLDAVLEVSTVMADAMRNADSDGTYSQAGILAGSRTP